MVCLLFLIVCNNLIFQSLNSSALRRVRDSFAPSMTDPDILSQVNDNDNLASRASSLLVRMCGVIPPMSLINPILDAIFEAIQASPVSVHVNFFIWWSDMSNLIVVAS